MKHVLVIVVLLSVCIIGISALSGCAAGSATAGYSMRAGSADDVSSQVRQRIVDEAVDKSFSKCKAYIDETCAKK